MDAFIGNINSIYWTGVLARSTNGWYTKAHGQMVHLDGLYNEDLKNEMIMVYEAAVQLQEGQIYLKVDGNQVVEIPSTQDLHLVKEICAGVGGMSQGLFALNFKTVAFLECNDFMCQALERNYTGKVICGDVTKPQDRQRLHETPSPSRGMITCGFPCQPISSQGDKRGEYDERSKPFFGAIKACWEQQASAVLLECTPAALEAWYIQEELQKLSWSLGMQVQQRILTLSNTWPCRRTRWWALMVPQHYYFTEIGDLPVDEHMQDIDSIFSTWPEWDEDTMSQLRVEDWEMEKYQDARYGSDQRRLGQKGPCPCILHSYGHPLVACPCGCRTSGFSEQRLLHGGLRGFYIVNKETKEARMLHPKEAALLCTMDPHMVFPGSGRDGLCLVGQCAAPIQAFWMVAHVSTSKQMGQKDLLEAVNHFKFQLLRQAYGAWPHEFPMELHMRDWEEQASFTILTKKRPMVQDILQAEDRMGKRGEIITIGDLLGKFGPDIKVGPGTVTGEIIMSKKNKMARSRPEKVMLLHYVKCQITGENGNDYEAVEAEAGTYLFEIFAKLGIWVDIEGSKDHQGVLWRADDRVWQPTIWMEYYQRKAKPMEGYGTHHRFGLTNGGVDWMAKTLVQLAQKKIIWIPSEITSCIFKKKEMDNEELIYMTATLYGAISAVVWNHHWFLIKLQVDGQLLHIEVWDGQEAEYQEEVALLGSQLKKALGIAGYYIEHKRELDQIYPFTCGTVALQHLGVCLKLWSAKNAPDELKWHQGLLHLCKPEDKLCGWGKATLQTPSSEERDAMWRLRDLLQQHGVPESRTEERAMVALSKMGLPGLMEALNNRNPWSALKALGSSPKVNMLLVKPDELDKQIKLRAQNKFKVSGAAKRGSTRQRKDEVIPDADSLILVDGSFIYSDGRAAKQLPMKEVGSNRTGIAFGAVADVLPFLAEGKSLSMEGLAVLTTAPIPTESEGLLPVRHLRYPAIYGPTGEAILLEGSMAQLGDDNICRRNEKIQVEHDALETVTIKVAIYRDEWPGEWKELAEAPLKVLTRRKPIFVLCRGQRCGGDCGKFHAPVDAEMDSVITDLWSRTWQSNRGGKTSPTEATQFQVLMRTPQICFKSLQALSGEDGVYVEPRKEDGRGPDPNYVVVWLENGTLAEAQHRQRTLDKIYAVCRFNHRYGLRVAAKDAEHIHGQVTPEIPFHGFQVQRIYEIRPLPHGMQKSGVQKLLKAAGWNAKPLQPHRADKNGAGWLVGTECEPPSIVMATTSGDITVTLHKQVKDRDHLPVVLSSSRTKAHIQKQPKGSVPDQESHDKKKNDQDPWAGWKDPWSRRGQHQEDDPMPAITKIDEVEGRLQGRIHQAIDQKMALEADARFKKLEVDVAEMKQQHVKYEGWFQEAAAASNNTQTQMVELQKQVTMQKQDMVTMKSDIGQVRSEIQTGFASIEALLNKKHRTE